VEDRASPTAILELRDVVKRFGRVTAVDHVSFEVRQGEVLTLLGPSGCGKTTTLRMVAGFERLDEGEIEIQGRLVSSASRRLHLPAEKRGLGMVFQSYAVWPHMTVFENVAYPLRLRRMGKREVKERVEQTLDLVGLGNLGERPSTMLSGGQQQRVALARALVYSPGILLLDEPLSNLDAKLRNSMRVELKRLQERVSVTVLFVTHDQIEAMSLSNRLAVMNLGNIEQLGTPQEVYEHPQTPFVEDFLGRVVRFQGTVVDTSWKGLLIELEGVGARLQVDADDALVLGQRVLVAIRPEDLELEGRGENTLACAVERVLYLGSECEVLVRAGNALFTLTVPRGKAAEIGQSIQLHLPPENLRVWAADEAASVIADDDGLLPAGPPLEAMSASGAGRAPGSV
jgi:ABC-type Fe3+/spermidine/putrescine transport system ATPase subunit